MKNDMDRYLSGDYTPRDKSKEAGDGYNIPESSSRARSGAHDPDRAAGLSAYMSGKSKPRQKSRDTGDGYRLSPSSGSPHPEKSSTTAAEKSALSMYMSGDYPHKPTMLERCREKAGEAVVSIGEGVKAFPGHFMAARAEVGGRWDWAGKLLKEITTDIRHKVVEEAWFGRKSSSMHVEHTGNVHGPVGNGVYGISDMMKSAKNFNEGREPVGKDGPDHSMDR